jgi:hypothetical protein
MYAGIESSLYFRIVSQSWEDWKDDWFWMIAYFSFGVWTSLFMATAPRVNEAKKTIQTNDASKKNK